MTRTSRSTSLAAVLAVGLLSLTACSGDTSGTSADNSPSASPTRTREEKAASKSISDKIMEAQKAGGTAGVINVKRKEADCIGDGFVDKIGVDKLKKYKLLDKDLKAQNDITQTDMSATDAKSATDVLFGCTDMQGLVKKAIGSTGGVSPKIKACIDKALTDQNLRSFMTSTFEGKTAEAQKALTDPLRTCATS